ncbi:MAG TPA: NADH-quinone oxidoreductase subunit E, partial [Pantoea sp.]|nr:NADH-quinone oxidoreductase subunit E [Pantoea sp.]
MHDQHIAIKTIDPNEVFVLSAEEHHAIEHEKHHYEDARAASIEALK